MSLRLPLMIACLCLGLLPAPSVRAQAQFETYKKIELLPELTVLDAGSDEARLISLYPGYALVNFWATWCGPCLSEMPGLERLQEDFSKDKLRVIPISIEGKRQLPRIRWFYQYYQLKKLPIYVLRSQEDQRMLEIRSVPVTFLLGPHGEKLWRALGPADWDDDAVRAMITRAIDKAEADKKQAEDD